MQADVQNIAVIRQGPGPATLGSDWRALVMVHEGLLPLEDLRVADTFMVLSSDDGYKTVDVLTESEACELARALAPEAVLKWGSTIRARDIHLETMPDNAASKPGWTNGLAVIVGVDLRLRTATVILRRGDEYHMKARRFTRHQAKVVLLDFQAG